MRELWASAGQPSYLNCGPAAPSVSLGIRDLTTGTETSYPAPPGANGALLYPISHLSWSPDGSRLAVSLGAVQDNAGWNLQILDPASARYYMSVPYPPPPSEVPVRGSPGNYYREGVFLPDGRLLVNKLCCAGAPVRTTSSLIEEVSTSGALLHLVAVGFTDHIHSSFGVTGKWILYLSGNDLFVSLDGRRPALLTSGLIAAAWIPAGQS